MLFSIHSPLECESDCRRYVGRAWCRIWPDEVALVRLELVAKDSGTSLWYHSGHDSRCMAEVLHLFLNKEESGWGREVDGLMKPLASSSSMYCLIASDSGWANGKILPLEEWCRTSTLWHNRLNGEQGVEMLSSCWMLRRDQSIRRAGRC